MLFLACIKTTAYHRIMDQDQDFLRAMIERRQQMLAKMGDQIKKEHQALETQVRNLISAFDQKLFFPEELKKN